MLRPLCVPQAADNPCPRVKAPAGCQAGQEAPAAPAMPGGPLTAAQIAEFKNEGVLILPGFVDEHQLRSWADQVWAGLAAGSGAEPDDPSSWRGKAMAVDMPAPLTPTPGELPQFRALMQQLGGGHFSGGGAQVAPIFPNTDRADWSLPSNGHVDVSSTHCLAICRRVYQLVKRRHV